MPNRQKPNLPLKNTVKCSQCGCEAQALTPVKNGPCPACGNKIVFVSEENNADANEKTINN